MTFAKPDPPALTPRQRELAVHLAHGATLREAAAAMGISSETAKTMAYEMRRRYDVETKLELFMRLGWHNPPPREELA